MQTTTDEHQVNTEQRGGVLAGREALVERQEPVTGRARGLAELTAAGMSPKWFIEAFGAYSSCAGQVEWSSLRMRQ